MDFQHLTRMPPSIHILHNNSESQKTYFLSKWFSVIWGNHPTYIALLAVSTALSIVSGCTNSPPRDSEKAFLRQSELVLLLDGRSLQRASNYATTFPRGAAREITINARRETFGGMPDTLFYRHPMRQSRILGFRLILPAQDGNTPAEQLRMYLHNVGPFEDLKGSISVHDEQMIVDLQVPKGSEFSGHVTRYKPFALNGTYNLVQGSREAGGPTGGKQNDEVPPDH